MTDLTKPKTWPENKWGAPSKDPNEDRMIYVRRPGESGWIFSTEPTTIRHADDTLTIYPTPEAMMAEGWRAD